MNRRYFIIIICVLSALMVPRIQSTAQDAFVTIESEVKDEEGNPISGALVYGNEGSVIVKTDAAGKFTISVPRSNQDLLIESPGYESSLFSPGESFTLKQSPFHFGERDGVNIAFGKVKKGQLANAVTVLNADEILEYDNNLDVRSAIAGRVPGLLGSTNLRGIGNAMVIVDGLPRDISTVNLSEIDKITFLKDINSAILYGNQAVSGVILITTKRGRPHRKDVKVTGYYGMSKPVALPKYLSSADYAELYNEARVNDGIAPAYTDEQIENFRTGNPYLYPNVDYYSSEYLKASKPFFRAVTELSGGNEMARYYTNLGWQQAGSLLNFGTGADAKQNVFNVRGNVDVQINHWIKTALDGAFVLNMDKGPVGDFWSEAATRHPNLVAPLIPIGLVNSEDPLLMARKNDVQGKYLLGGSQTVLQNAIANGYAGGYDELIQRTFSFNNRIDFDLGELAGLEGLAFHTNVSFDFFTRYNQSVTNSYSVYEPIWNAGGTMIDGLKKWGEDNRTGTQNITNEYFERRFGFYGMLDYNRTFNDLHSVSAALVGFAARHKMERAFWPTKNANLGLRLAYGYDNKYLIDFSSAYVASAKLPEGNRGGFSPSVGLAWVLSEEDFLKGAPAVDYLKLRVSGGIMNTDAGIGGHYLYDNMYGYSGGFAWNEGAWANSGVVSIQGENTGLFFEKRKELNFGFEGMFFDNLLYVDANVFTSVYSDQITRPQTAYPSYYTNFIPYQNFDKNAYRGVEFGLSVSKTVGQVALTVGGNAMYATSEVLRRDEIYQNDYQRRTGHPIDATFGLVADGFFRDQADIDNHATQAFGGTVRPGDIKYIDQNNDGVVDANDEVAIGRTMTPFSYGLTLKASYRSFTLFALGRGGHGGNAYRSSDYFWVDGNDKYSEVVLDRWTESTKETATYPRLSSIANPNNFRNSTFWLYDNNFFNISRIQLTYSVPDLIARTLRMTSLNVFADASNVVTISKSRKITDLRVGSEPNYRSYSLGLRIMF